MARKKNIKKKFVLSDIQRTVTITFNPALNVVEVSAPKEAPVLAVSDPRLQAIADREGTQFHFVLPNGVVIRAGRNPLEAARVDLAQIVRGKAAADVPLEILQEARRQLGL